MRGDGRIYKRGRRYWIEYWYHGRPFRESAGDTEAAAKKRLKARWREIAGDKFVGPIEERVSVDDLIDDLLTHLRTKGAKSVPAYESHLKPIRAFFSLRRASEVTTAYVEKYIAERLSNGRARATINRETGALAQAFALATKRQPPKLGRAPYVPKLNEDNARSGFFERDQFERVVANLPGVVADIARFAYLSGWRKGEILGLRWEAVDRRAGEVRLATSKNGKPRTLPLVGALAGLIESRWAAREFERPDKTTGISAFVFHAGDGCAIVDFKRSWATACAKAGLARLETMSSGKVKVIPLRLFHDLRRTAVRDMIRAGVPQSVAMRISGHRTTAMFTRYDITSEDDKREALRRTEEHRAARPAEPPKVVEGSFGSSA